MDQRTVNVLLIEDNADDIAMIREQLTGVRAYGLRLNLEHANTMISGLSRLDETETDIVLIDLNLPDSRGLDSLDRVLKNTGNTIPTIVLTNLSDEETAVDAVRCGAQDYVSKDMLGCCLVLPRVIRYALERHRLHQRMRELSLRDEMTGLYNRRGFLDLARKQLEMYNRVGKEAAILYIDLDGLKIINDTFGHREGDKTILSAADILSSTFRGSDILARVGGDEFVVFAGLNHEESPLVLQKRLREHLDRHNAGVSPGRHVLLSIGSILCSDFGSECTVEMMVDKADEQMYLEKTRKRRQRQNIHDARSSCAVRAQTGS